MDPRWLHPFTAIVAGPTGSGKTYFMMRFIDNVQEMIVPPPQKIIWYYGQWQDAYRNVKNVEFVEGLPPKNSEKYETPTLWVIDDQMAEIDSSVTKVFTKGSHHLNISVVFIVQNIFSNNKEHRTISLNTHYMILFKNPRDKTQISHLGKQMFPGKSNYMQESYLNAVSKPYGYLLIDLRQQTPDHLRLRTDIFPQQNQVVYIQK